MSKIWVTSDWHLNHDRPFIWQARGFESVEEMNEEIICRHNILVQEEDDVYVLGDLCLGGGGHEALAANKEMIERFKGKIHIILGNHDTPARVAMYQTCKNVVEVAYATMLHYNGYHFFMSHFPCITANLEKETLKQCTIGLHGHTHAKERFYQGIPFLYQVGMDAQGCFPVDFDDAIEDMKNEVKKYKEQL